MCIYQIYQLFAEEGEVLNEHSTVFPNADKCSLSSLTEVLLCITTATVVMAIIEV